jgi:ElaB/YqjD/DUF883 family membrane-anchored ribosome-binding protein
MTENTQNLIEIVNNLKNQVVTLTNDMDILLNSQSSQSGEKSQQQTEQTDNSKITSSIKIF